MRRAPWVVLLIAGLTTACGGDDGDSGGGPRIKGRVGEGFQVLASRSLLEEFIDELVGGKAYAAGGDTVDRIAAIPTFRGAREHIKEVEVASDGSFSLQLDVGWDWVILLINSQAPRSERISGYVTMGAGAHSMLAFPMPDVIDDVQLGQVEPQASGAEDEAPAQNGIEANLDSFTLSVSELEAIAKSDNVMLFVLNDYLNYDHEAAAHYEVNVAYAWQAPLAELLNGPAADEFNYEGFGVSVKTNDPFISGDDLCANRQVIDLVPPAEVLTRVGQRFGPDAPLSSAGSGGEPTYCGNDLFIASEQPDGSFDFVFGSSIFFDSFPGQWWELRVGGEERASFNLGFSDPQPDETITVPVPIPELEQDGSGIITSLRARWHVYDPDDGGYVEMTDLSGLGRLIERVSVEIAPVSGRDVGLPTDAKGVVSDVGTWRLTDAPAGEGDVNGMTISYVAGGVGYSFYWGYPRNRETVLPGPNLRITALTPVGAGIFCPATHFDVEVTNEGTHPATLDRAELVGGDPYVAVLDDNPDVADPVELLPGMSTVVRLSFAPPFPITERIDVTFRADPLGLVEEPYEDDNEWTHSAVLNVPLPTDLVVSAVALDPTSVTAGESVTATVTLEPTGPGAEAVFCSGHRLWSVTGAGDAAAAKVADGEILINPGATLVTTAEMLIPWTTVGGTYDVSFQVDPDDIVAEVDETNNTRSTPLTVESAPPRPELHVTATGFLNGEGPCAPQRLRIEVTNSGTASTVIASRDLVALDVVGEGEPGALYWADASAGFLTLDPGTTTVGEANLTGVPHASGTVAVEIVVDPTDFVAEHVEANNVTVASWAIPDFPTGVDLTIYATGVTPQPALTQEYVRVELDIENLGTGTAYQCAGTVIYSHTRPDGAARASTRSSHRAIAPGMSVSTVLPLSPYTFTPGVHEVIFTVDPNGNLMDTDASNNAATVSIAVSPPVAGTTFDLRVADTRFDGALGPCPPNHISVDVANDGDTVVVISARDLLEVSDFADSWVVAAFPADWIAIEPGGTVTAEANLSIPDPYPPSTLLTVTVDPTGFITESDETNNTATPTLVIPAPPTGADLLVSSVGLTPNPAAESDQVWWTASVDNAGSAPAYLCSGRAQMRYVLPGIGARVTASSGHLMIAAGGTHLATHFINSYTLTPNSYDIPWTVDPDNHVAESDETNNDRTAILVVE